MTLLVQQQDVSTTTNQSRFEKSEWKPLSCVGSHQGHEVHGWTSSCGILNIPSEEKIDRSNMPSPLLEDMALGRALWIVERIQGGGSSYDHQDLDLYRDYIVVSSLETLMVDCSINTKNHDSAPPHADNDHPHDAHHHDSENDHVHNHPDDHYDDMLNPHTHLNDLNHLLILVAQQKAQVNFPSTSKTAPSRMVVVQPLTGGAPIFIRGEDWDIGAKILTDDPEILEGENPEGALLAKLKERFG